MSSSIKTSSFLSLIALLSFYLWEKTVFIANEEQQHWYLIVHICVVLILLISIKWTFIPSIFQPYLKGLIAVSLFFILFILWNILFRWYSDSFDFKGNIFRGIFYGFRAPFYGRLNLKIVLADYYPLIISSILFIFLVFRIKWGNNSKWIYLALLIIGSLLFFSFAWDTSFHKTLMAANCHYKTFSEGLSAFPEWSTFLPAYTEQMKFLGAHNNHYPPGVLMLMKLNNESFPYLFKILVLIAPILSIFPLRALLKHFSISNESINVYIAFYISSSALLFFPGKAITPLHLPIATTFLYLFVKSIHNGKIGYALIAGLILALYAFLSFSFIVFGFFCFVYLSTLLFYSKIEFKQIVKPSLTIGVTFVFIYTVIYLFFDFNLITCFNTALHNESAQMKITGGDSLARYFIVSSGNLLAYIGVFAPIIIGIYAERIHSGALRSKTPFVLLIKSVLLTIIILSFSGGFHLEVERIWIFLTPFVLFVILLYGPVSKMKNLSYIRIALTLNIIISVVYSIMIDKCS